MKPDVVVWMCKPKSQKWQLDRLLTREQAEAFIARLEAKPITKFKYKLIPLHMLKKKAYRYVNWDIIRDAKGMPIRMEGGSFTEIPARPSQEELNRLRLEEHERTIRRKR